MNVKRNNFLFCKKKKTFTPNIFYNISFAPIHDTFLTFYHDSLATDDRQCFAVLLGRLIRRGGEVHLENVMKFSNNYFLFHRFK